MGIVTFLTSLFTLVANVKELAAYADKFFTNILALYMSNASEKRKMDMADAMVAFASASNDEEIFAAQEKVKESMQRARYLP